MRLSIIGAGVVALVTVAAPAVAAGEHHRTVHGNWYDAKPYGHPRCVINGDDTVIVCPSGRVFVSPRAARQIRRGATSVR